MKKTNITFIVIMGIIILIISSLLIIACCDDSGYNFISKDTLYNEDISEETPYDEDTLYMELFWDASTEADLAGYKIYYGTESGNYVNVIDVGNVTTYLVKDMDITKDSVYYIAVTAYDTSNNESDFSEEVCFEY